MAKSVPHPSLSPSIDPMGRGSKKITASPFRPGDFFCAPSVAEIAVNLSMRMFDPAGETAR